MDIEALFDIPIVLFFFKRRCKTVQVLQRIAQVKPSKLYLVSDYGRDHDEINLVLDTRKAVEDAINWNCEVIKDYAFENKGVYEQIGMGAKRILEQEWAAIFLEDDNLPEVSFFFFCKEMLELYCENEKILWVCGTNYLEMYEPDDRSDYVFTQHMLPCGWASWGHKYPKYYDYNLSHYQDLYVQNKLNKRYNNYALYRYDVARIFGEVSRAKKGDRYLSWDYHMAASLRVHSLYGVAPKNNQIMNIGVDEFSTHGGNSFNCLMTRRFCGIKSYPLDFPLTHPKSVSINRKFERLTTKIVIPPWYLLKLIVGLVIRHLLKIPDDISIRKAIVIMFNKNSNKY